ncbi:hypothetical protein ACIA8K_29825 [Catenuloplanes sp. NPDC051500]|uniref:hypothetical protein n=1 Tax=Catenuloplanes sp. NPDC051500 TaxID=3363959 RepID=UPI0037ACB693
MSTWTVAQVKADPHTANAAIRAAAPGANIPYPRAPYDASGQSAQVAAGLSIARLG